VLILGHRGASQAHPENTLQAFQAAYEANADGLEWDVHATSDGIPVLTHDRSLARRTGDVREVDMVTLDELKALDAGNGQQIPTLAEALALCDGRGYLDIEVKQSGVEQQVLDVLEGYKGAWGISSFDWTSLVAFRELSDTAELWLLAIQVNRILLETAARIQAKGIALYYQAIDAQTVTALHADGLQIFAWTVNDEAEAKRLNDLGVDGLITDVPETIKPLVS
jgi:glycerophosphoryl diester phosphodiesterase